MHPTDTAGLNGSPLPGPSPPATTCPSPPAPTTISFTYSADQGGTLLTSYLALLVEGVRELKTSNQELHNELRQLRERQQEICDKVERLSQATPPRKHPLAIRPFFAQVSLTLRCVLACGLCWRHDAGPLAVDIPNRATVPCASFAQRELYRMMPFLSDYRINGSFVIDDLR